MFDVKLIDDIDVKNKKVLLRVDFNVPIKNDVIQSDLRIFKALPTIEYLLSKNAKVIIVSHMGRPKSVDKNLSLKPVAEHLSKLLNRQVHFLDYPFKSEKVVEASKTNEIIMLENIRFEDGETNNSKDLSKNLASSTDIFINDAFATLHRKHSSSYGVAEEIPSAAGYLVFEELQAAKNTLENPDKPVTLVLGGAKVADKIKIIETFLEKQVDKIVIGGGMAFTFIKAINGDVGDSIVDDESVEYCKKLIKRIYDKNIKLILPEDVVISKSINSSETRNSNIINIPKGFAGFDIGEKSIKTFKKEIVNSATIIWNGPMGVFENEKFTQGTMQVIEAISNSPGYKYVGGGDSVSALEKYTKKVNIDHVSTGGGASLELLSGKNLPGVEILKKK